MPCATCYSASCNINSNTLPSASPNASGFYQHHHYSRERCEHVTLPRSSLARQLVVQMKWVELRVGASIFHNCVHMSYETRNRDKTTLSNFLTPRCSTHGGQCTGNDAVCTADNALPTLAAQKQPTLLICWPARQIKLSLGQGDIQMVIVCSHAPTYKVLNKENKTEEPKFGTRTRMPDIGLKKRARQERPPIVACTESTRVGIPDTFQSSQIHLGSKTLKGH